MGRQLRPACILYILDGSETRLLRIVVVVEGRSTSILQGDGTKRKSWLFDKCLNNIGRPQCPFSDSTKELENIRKKEKKGEILIYDLLRAPDLRLTSTSNEIYATWLPASFCTFVFCFLLVTLEDFPQIKIFFIGRKEW